MRYAEVFLRLGCALVAWMVLYAYASWLAVAPSGGCADGSGGLFRLLLGMGPAAAALGPLILATRTLADVHRLMRWLSLPLLALLPFALIAAWRVFDAVWLRGRSICTAGEPAHWEYAWLPVTLAALATIAVTIVVSWRRAG